MNKEERIEHILQSALLARYRYDKSNEASHLAQYFKGMSIINSMTGDNAPTQIEHLVKVTTQQLDDMTKSQRTEAYKRMMSGNLQLIELQTSNDEALIIEGETLTSDEGGDT